MMKIFMLLFFCLILGDRAFSASDLSVQAKTFIQDLVEVAKQSKVQPARPSEEIQKKIAKVSDQINFTTLAQLSFSKRWGSFRVQDKKEFLEALQNILETVAYPQAQKFSAELSDMEFKNIGAHQVSVSGRVNREKRGEIMSEKFDLILIYDKSGVKIVDSVIEGEKISVNLNRQFSEALKKKTFPEIILQMKKRVQDVKAKNESAL